MAVLFFGLYCRCLDVVLGVVGLLSPMRFGVGARTEGHNGPRGVFVKVGKHRACTISRTQASLMGRCKKRVWDMVKRGWLSKRKDALLDLDHGRLSPQFKPRTEKSERKWKGDKLVAPRIGIRARWEVLHLDEPIDNSWGQVLLPFNRSIVHELYNCGILTIFDT